MKSVLVLEYLFSIIFHQLPLSPIHSYHQHKHPTSNYEHTKMLCRFLNVTCSL